MSNELKANEFLLKIEDPATPGTYQTIGGLRTNAGTLNREPVEVTSKGSNGWRKILGAAGVKSIDVSGEGVTEKTNVFKWLLEAWNGVGQVNAQLDMAFGSENVVSIKGAFHVASLEFSGENDKEVPFSVSLQSADEPDVQIF